MLASAWRLANTPIERIATVSDDPDLQFFLSRLTAEGAVPLRDFEHAFNVGAWYLGAGLYYLVGGNRFMWTTLWSIVIPTAVATVVAYLWMRRRGVTRLAAAVVVAAMTVLFPLPNVRYLLPLLAVVAIDTCRRRSGWESAGFAWCVAATTAAVTVVAADIAAYLAAGVVCFAAVDARAEGRAWPVVLRRSAVTAAAAGAAFIATLAAEAAVLRVAGLGVGSFLDQLFGHSDDFVERYGWSLLFPDHAWALFAVVLVGLPLLPGLLRSASSSARLVAMTNLVLLAVAIRRSDQPHFEASMTLVPVAWGLMFCSLPRDRDWGTVRRLWRDGGGVGVLVTVGLLVVVGAGLEIRSLAGVALVVGSVVLVVLVTVGLRGADATGAIAGPAAVLVAATVTATLVASYSTATDDESLDRFASVSDAAHAVLDSCDVGAGSQAWIVPGPLALYEWLDVSNPTTYYRFHYDFPKFEDDVTARLEDGSIPFVLLVGDLVEATAFIEPTLREHYEECAISGEAPTGPMYGFRYRTA